MTAPSNANTSGLAPTDALRLVPFETIEAQAEAWSDRVKIQHMVEANSAVFAKWASPELLSRFRQQMMAVIQQAYIEGAAEAAPASPLPGGGPHERWSILNHLGELWTPENFDTERQATDFLDGWKRDNPKMDLSKHKVIPVLVTMTAAPTGAK